MVTCPSRNILVAGLDDSLPHEEPPAGPAPMPDEVDETVNL